jgi:error-prone DNA polymerase
VKGTYRLTRDDVAALGSRCLALWLPALDLRADATDARVRDDAAFVRDVFAARAWIGVELLAQAGDAARLAQSTRLGRAFGLPLVAAGDAHMHVRARRALQDTLTAIRLRTPLAQCGHALFPNGERHLRSRARLAGVYPPELLAETVRIAQRCTFSLDALRYEYPEEIVPPGETATSWLRKQVEGGLAERYWVRAIGVRAVRIRATRARSIGVRAVRICATPARILTALTPMCFSTATAPSAARASPPTSAR